MTKVFSSASSNPLPDLDADVQRAYAATCEWIDEHVDAVVDLLRTLIRFDTTAVEPGRMQTASNEERECQTFLRTRLRGLGALVEEINPDPAEFRNHPMMPPGHHWNGREMTLARFPGTGRGHSLIINGHIDVVNAEPREVWSVDPFAAEVVDGKVVGRGSVDMKGGLATALFAVEALQAIGFRLRGDVWLQVVTDEETTGMGSVAMARFAPRADAAVCPEPTAFDVWVACRGVMYAEVLIQGRPGHAELPQPDWRDGGAVNAIQKLGRFLEAIDAVNALWLSSEQKRHSLLAPPALVPTLIHGGEFIGTHPAQCMVTLDVTYLPHEGDGDGFGALVRREVEHELRARTERDPWLAQHPLEISWLADYPPYAVGEAGDDFIAAVERASGVVGANPRRTGLDSWHDAATLGLFGGTPAISFGPGPRGQAHRPNEAMSIAALVQGAKAFSALLLDWCNREPVR